MSSKNKKSAPRTELLRSIEVPSEHAAVAFALCDENALVFHDYKVPCHCGHLVFVLPIRLCTASTPWALRPAPWVVTPGVVSPAWPACHARQHSGPPKHHFRLEFLEGGTLEDGKNKMQLIREPQSALEHISCCDPVMPKHARGRKL